MVSTVYTEHILLVVRRNKVWQRPVDHECTDKMGFACQESCYLVPDLQSTLSTQNEGKLQHSERKKLMRRRRGQLHRIFCEARLWALSTLLPLDMFSEKPDYYSALRETTATLYGERYEEDKINCKPMLTCGTTCKIDID